MKHSEGVTSKGSLSAFQKSCSSLDESYVRPIMKYLLKDDHIQYMSVFWKSHSSPIQNTIEKVKSCSKWYEYLKPIFEKWFYSHFEPIQSYKISILDELEVRVKLVSKCSIAFGIFTFHLAAFTLVEWYFEWAPNGGSKITRHVLGCKAFVAW